MANGKRDLTILTRSQGVRKENPLLTVGPYYPHSSTRTPELRKGADQLTRRLPKSMQKRLVSNR